MSDADAGFDLSNLDAEQIADLAAAAERITSGNGGPEEEPEIAPPSDGPVALPGGFRRVEHTPEGMAFKVVSNAWIRELTGEDEERIDKARRMGNGNDFVDALLEGGVERLGDQKPTRDEIRGLLVGDADYLLLEISRATFGNDLEVENYVCPSCGESLSFTIHKDTDIPVKRLNSYDEVEFEVRLKNDRIAVLTLPTGDIQRQTSNTETDAQANTIILANCVREIRSGSETTRFDGDLEAARKLGVQDRRALIRALDEHMPGPRYDGVTFTHPECGNEVRVAVTAADLFLGI